MRRPSNRMATARHGWKPVAATISSDPLTPDGFPSEVGTWTARGAPLPNAPTACGVCGAGTGGMAGASPTVSAGTIDPPPAAVAVAWQLLETAPAVTRPAASESASTAAELVTVAAGVPDVAAVKPA